MANKYMFIRRENKREILCIDLSGKITFTKEGWMGFEPGISSLSGKYLRYSLRLYYIWDYNSLGARENHLFEKSVMCVVLKRTV